MRVMTYNVHRCLGRDRSYSPERIAEVIASVNPDIVALQEIDVGKARSGGFDQVREINRSLGYAQTHFFPAVRREQEHYGDAVLTRTPSSLVKADLLPGPRRSAEPRGAIWIEGAFFGQHVQIVNTHLGLRGMERLLQVEALLGPAWIGRANAQTPIILMGDFNAVPYSRVYRRIARVFSDAQTTGLEDRPKPTFPSRAPFLRIDHIFLSRGSWKVVRCEVLRTPLARRASDHLPLFADLAPLSPHA